MNYSNQTKEMSYKNKTIEVYYNEHTNSKKPKKRVAAYCRVSTDSDGQLCSLENQIEAFRYQIAMRKDWELAEIYYDEGITGTSIKHRKAFQKMIDDCKNGKIDYIITKSISRFARNTVDCLNYVRQLQSFGVQLYFEKEGIDTAESMSEMLLVVMAAFAQEESRSISENVKWGLRKRFEAGKEMRIPIYGYKHTKDELYTIVPEEAAIVKEVFTRYAHGETPSEIVKDMSARNVRPPAGDKWKILQIARMVHNEKYTGDVVLQKHYIENHLTHKEVKNNGELPLYRIRNAHAAIIDKHLFAQAEAVTRMRNVKKGNSSYPYGDLLRCPHCGETLVHGSLFALEFMGKKINNGGWGCYGNAGCRNYMLIQNLLDEAMIYAYETRYGVTPERVDYYWLEELIDCIELTDDKVTVYWKEGREHRIMLSTPDAQLSPKMVAEKYNRFLDNIKSGRRKINGKYIMGL